MGRGYFRLSFEQAARLEESCGRNKWESEWIDDLCDGTVLARVRKFVEQDIWERYRNAVERHAAVTIADAFSMTDCEAVGCSKWVRTRILTACREYDIVYLFELVNEDTGRRVVRWAFGLGEESARVISAILANYGLRPGIAVPKEIQEEMLKKLHSTA